MTEAEWVACGDPARMVEHLRATATGRKLRLFTVAACYLRPDYGGEPHPQLESVVRYADGVGGPAEVREHWFGSGDQPPWPERPYEWAGAFVGDSLRLDGSDPDSYPPPAELLPLLRDVFGNPFRPATADPAWLTSTVVALATSAYADRAFDRLPILADALQDAGCDHPDILAHLRGPGPHVRGCWAVDLVLGRA